MGGQVWTAGAAPGVPSTRIGDTLRGEMPPLSPTPRIRLTPYFGISPEFWLNPPNLSLALAEHGSAIERDVAQKTADTD
jgi:plasmid maintenance system antidote protein VapI